MLMPINNYTLLFYVIYSAARCLHLQTYSFENDCFMYTIINRGKKKPVAFRASLKAHIGGVQGYILTSYSANITTCVLRASPTRCSRAFSAVNFVLGLRTAGCRSLTTDHVNVVATIYEYDTNNYYNNHALRRRRRSMKHNGGDRRKINDKSRAE